MRRSGTSSSRARAGSGSETTSSARCDQLHQLDCSEQRRVARARAAPRSERGVLHRWRSGSTALPSATSRPPWTSGSQGRLRSSRSAIPRSPIATTSCSTMRPSGRPVSGRGPTAPRRRCPVVLRPLLRRSPSCSPGTPSTDDVGIGGYDVFRGGTLVASLGNVTNYTDTHVLASTSYSYTVRARDTSGNPSAQSAPLPVTTPAAAAPVFADGFESGDLSAWTHHRRAHHRRQSPSTAAPMRPKATRPAAGPYAKKTLPSTYADGYARVWFQVVSQTSQVNLLRLRDAADASIGFAYIGTTGRLGFHNDALGTNVLSATSPGPGWHALELHVLTGGASGMVELWLDNVPITDLSGATTTSAAPVGRFQIGETQTTGQIYDVVFDDAAFGDRRLGPVADSPPTVPGNLAATTPSPYSVSLTWDASTDDLGVGRLRPVPRRFAVPGPWQCPGLRRHSRGELDPHVRSQGSRHVWKSIGADLRPSRRPRRPIIRRPSRRTSPGRLHRARRWS